MNKSEDWRDLGKGLFVLFLGIFIGYTTKNLWSDIVVVSVMFIFGFLAGRSSTKFS